MACVALFAYQEVQVDFTFNRISKEEVSSPSSPLTDIEQIIQGSTKGADSSQVPVA